MTRLGIPWMIMLIALLPLPVVAAPDAALSTQAEIHQRFAELKSAYALCEGAALAKLVDRGISRNLVDGATIDFFERSVGGVSEYMLSSLGAVPLGRTSFELAAAHAEFSPPRYGWSKFLAEDCRKHHAEYFPLFDALQLGKIAVAETEAVSLIDYVGAPTGAVLYWRHDGQRWNPRLSRLLTEYFDALINPAAGETMALSATRKARAEFMERHAARIVSPRDAADRIASVASSQVSELRMVDISALPNADGDPRNREALRNQTWRLGAEDGDSEAALRLAYDADERDTIEGFREAAHWLTLAANAGNAEAQDLLGLYYQDGRGGLEADCRQAIKWLRHAVEGKYPGSNNNLAWVLVTSRDAGCRDAELAESLLADVDVNSQQDAEDLDDFITQLDTIAAIRCESGRVAESIALQQRVVKHFTFDTRKSERLRMYRAGTCWRGGSVFTATPDSSP